MILSIDIGAMMPRIALRTVVLLVEELDMFVVVVVFNLFLQHDVFFWLSRKSINHC